MKKLFLTLLFVPLLLVASAARIHADTPRGIEKINHVVIIFMENWTFDAHYGQFPGANDMSKGFDFNQSVLSATGANPYDALWMPMVVGILMPAGGVLFVTQPGLKGEKAA